MFAQGGSVSVAGSISFTQQDPWIQNMTLRDNVLMGEPYDAARYQRVLKACAMGTGGLLVWMLVVQLVTSGTMRTAM